MTDPELPDRMGQLEKTVNASTTPKNKYADYSDSQKTLFVYYLQPEKLRLTFVLVRIGLRNPRMILIGIFSKKQTNKVHIKESQLQDEHKTYLIEFFDENPHVRVSDAVEELTKNFKGFTLKENHLHNFVQHSARIFEDCLNELPI